MYELVAVMFVKLLLGLGTSIQLLIFLINCVSSFYHPFTLGWDSLILVNCLTGVLCPPGQNGLFFFFFLMTGNPCLTTGISQIRGAFFWLLSLHLDVLLPLIFLLVLPVPGFMFLLIILCFYRSKRRR